MVNIPGNLSSNMLVPPYLRRRYMQLTDMYDNQWMPWFMRMMPKQVAEGRGSKRYWTRPRMADPQMMAKYYEPDEAVEAMNKPHVRPWSYNTRTIGNAFTRTKQEWAGDFEGGVLERSHAMLLENLTKSINRTIEFTLCRFGIGDSSVMEEFTNQDLNRQAQVNLETGNFNAVLDAGLGAQAWDDFTTTPPVFEDLAYLIERFEFMAGESPNMLAIGRKTALALELNDDLLDRLIRITDTTDGVLGASIMGLNVVKVVGQTYKEVPGARATVLEGYPGKGDYLEMDWQHLNRIDMMTELDGATRKEWGVISNGGLGEVACGFVDEDHGARGNPTNIFVEQWDTRNPKIVWTSAKLEVCPVVYDYARIMRIEKMASQ